MSTKPNTKWKKQFYLGGNSDAPSPEVTEVAEHFKSKGFGLIDSVQELQEKYGYLPKKQLEQLAQEVGVSVTQLYGIITFYTQFRLTPPGKNLVKVCRGTACHVQGAPEILDHICSCYGIKEGQTTEDGELTLQAVACVGACGLAPVVVVNESVHGKMDAEKGLGVVQAAVEKDKN